MSEENKVCYICGEPCEDGWGWMLFEFWGIPEPLFHKMEVAVSEIEKKYMCRKHLVGAFQVMRDYLQSGGNMDAFLAKMDGRHDA